MMIVSSQRFIDWDIVEQKMDELSASGVSEVTIPCWSIGEVDGVEMAIQSDKHHTLAAARELGLAIRYEFSDEPEGLTGVAALDAHYNDGDWYNVETSDPASDSFDTIW